MERQKNHLQFVANNKNLLPIEEEFLFLVKTKIEKKLNSKISSWAKQYSHPLYDCFLIVVGEKDNQKPFYLKVNLSPDIPNFWQELIDKKFLFHPNIVCFSDENDEFKFICFEIPKGVFLSDLSKYPLSPKINIQRQFIATVNEMHSIKISEEDETLNIFNSFLPNESIMIFKNYPVVDLFFPLKAVFKNFYKSNLDNCGLCHFDPSPENIILTSNGIKFINFEYSCNANIYLDIWLMKQVLNCSDSVFDTIIDTFPKNKIEKIYEHRELSYFFNFAYFNSKIISEYITFGINNPNKLKNWIHQSELCYDQIFDKLFIEKHIDKLIRDFYYLWK